MTRQMRKTLASLVVDSLVGHAAARQRKSVRAIEPKARELLARNVWRVNVAELHDMIEHVVAVTDDDTVITGAQVTQLLLKKGVKGLPC